MAQKATVVRIQGKSEWRCMRGKGGSWVGVCHPLALTVQSETWATLMEDIADTLNMMLLDLLKENEFDKFLRDRGWTLVGRIPRPLPEVRFDVPFVAHLSDRDRQVAVR